MHMVYIWFSRSCVSRNTGREGVVDMRVKEELRCNLGRVKQEKLATSDRRNEGKRYRGKSKRRHQIRCREPNSIGGDRKRMGGNEYQTNILTQNQKKEGNRKKRKYADTRKLSH
ncbi:hypothetical protein ABW21_db0202445 [Orbilia brochopaga]|nr:hypothetical protein ABW21_db0202445 [Drechslerella brochopaga]